MKNSIRAYAIILALTSVFLFTSQAYAYIWLEWDHGDAGHHLDTAQEIDSGDDIEGIRGRISNWPGIDMYKFELFDDDEFSGATVIKANFDTQLFLFDEDGYGLYANDNLAKGTLLSALPAIDLDPGTYYLAISRYDRNPRNSDGRIFKNFPRYEVHDADGPGANSPLASWSKDDENEGEGRYFIYFNDTNAVPEPGTLSLLGIGLLGLLGAGRRKQNS